MKYQLKILHLHSRKYIWKRWPSCLGLNVLRVQTILTLLNNGLDLTRWQDPMTFIHINSLAPGKSECNFRFLIFQKISVIDGWVVTCKLALRWMSLNLTDDKSILIQVMAWCRQATSHYLSQCWPRSLSPHGVTNQPLSGWYVSAN